jgi:hypothetical protein
MPILRGHLISGLALVDVLVGPTPGQVRVLRQAGSPIPQPVAARAVIDPAAALSSVDVQILSSLGSTDVGSIIILTTTTGAAGSLQDQYEVSLEVPFPGGAALRVSSLLVLGSQVRATGSDMLLGTDVLRYCRFVYDGRAGTYELEF